MRSAHLLTVLILGLPVAATASAQERGSIEIEMGPAWQSRNLVQVPNDPSGSRFSLEALTGSGPWASVRLYASWRVGNRHELRALVAPLELTETDALEGAVNFAGETYEPGATEGTYQFNSYRVSYRYRAYRSPAWTWWIGFTAKVRDARIRLRQEDTTSRKTDLGFVPLLHVAGDWRFAPGWGASLDADALAGGPGRAEDVALKLRRQVGQRWTVAGGYRMVEGGADVDAVYAFAWFHYGVVSVAYRF